MWWSYGIFFHWSLDWEELFGVHWFYVEDIQNLHIFVTLIPFFPFHWVIAPPPDSTEDLEDDEPSVFGQDTYEFGG